MLVFVDESGTHRQSGFSVIALVCVESPDAVKKLDQQVLGLEKRINTTNFHWARKGWPIRHKFIEGIASLNFTIRIAQLNNPIKIDEALIAVLPHLLPEPSIDRLFVDGKKSKHYARSLKKTLRDMGLSVKKLRLVNDRSFPVIRIADAAACTARYRLDNSNKRANKIYDILKPKIEFTYTQK